MTRKLIQTNIISLFLFALTTSPATAGKLYRFADENGVKTMSRSLPAIAAQKGYDVLDDKTFRLIEHIGPALTPKQITELKHQKEQDKIAQQKVDKTEKEAQEKRDKRADYDRKLLASYHSEQALIRARDSELNYRQDLITKNTAKQKKLDKTAIDLQKIAADRELSGRGISGNLKKRLSANQKQTDNNQSTIKRLHMEISVLTTKFDADLSRLHTLLQSKKK